MPIERRLRRKFPAVCGAAVGRHGATPSFSLRRCLLSDLLHSLAPHAAVICKGPDPPEHRSGAEHMEEDDLTELARICLKHAKAAKTPKLARALLQMAKEYQRRAAQLRSGHPPPRRRGRVALSPQLIQPAT
jgi:hypothetical protein